MRISYTALRYVSVVWIVYISLLFNVLQGYSCLAQSPSFKHLDVRSGLAQNGILTIAQDTRGFMWFGTPEGLCRYDSRSFKTYENKETDPHSISSSFVSSSYYDSHQTLWFGTAKGLNKYNPQTDSFQQILHDPAVKSSLTSNTITCIYEDRRGNIWVGTKNGLNRLIDPATNRFERYFFSESTSRNAITSIAEDQEGNLWVATNDGLVRLRLDRNRVHCKTFTHERSVLASLNENFVTAVAVDSQNKLWVGTKSGDLDRYDPSTESFSHFRHITTGKTTSAHNEINCMYADKVGNIWIGTVEGIIQLESATLKVNHYQNDPDNPLSLSDNSVYSLFRDNQGSIWAGTYYGGVNAFNPDYTPFYTLKASRAAKGLSSKRANCIAEDQQHNLWIGADGEGLDYINQQTGLITHYVAGIDPVKNLPSNQIKKIYVDNDGYTWVGMRRGGLCRLDPAHRQWTTYPYSSNKNLDNVCDVLEDSQKRFWVAAVNEIALFDRDKGTFQTFDYKNALNLDSSITSARNFVLLEDKHKNMWFGGNEGVYLLRNKRTRLEWLPFDKNAQNVNSPGHGVVNTIHEDIHGAIWVGTYYDGLKRFDAKRNKFVNYSKSDGLHLNAMNAIQSDNTGKLWIGTFYHLIRYDPVTKDSYYYNHSDGIPGSELQDRASYRNSTGRLYFGTNDGLLYFDPSAIHINNRPPTVIFTALEVDNKVVTIGDESNLLGKDIGLTDQLTFNYRQNFFTINFAVLNYIKSEKNQYAYKLDGLDQEWHYIKTPSITYNNLSAGEYTLLVKGANNDGVWSANPTQLRLVILPPWWRSWWAYSLYILAFGLLLYMVLRFFWLRDSFKRERELNQAKLDFFTNISHEIRTHLTLIIGPIDLLMSTRKEDKAVQKQLTYAKNSSESLLNLVSELITFRKAESSQLELRVSQNDIIPFLKNIMASFLHHSEQRNIQLYFSSNSRHIQLGFDPGQIEKVIYNLLSNAFKFMSNGGDIRIDVEEKEEWVAIAISDTGRGISPENVKKLFTNYFQVHDYGTQNTGYGIGLALSRKIAELHGGTLTVESREARNGENGFTCFTLMLQKERSKVLN
jgi:ligand-binding sensor domain-containing protein/signal transduction histidine kinase